MSNQTRHQRRSPTGAATQNVAARASTGDSTDFGNAYLNVASPGVDSKLTTCVLIGHRRRDRHRAPPVDSRNVRGMPRISHIVSSSWAGYGGELLREPDVDDEPLIFTRELFYHRAGRLPVVQINLGQNVHFFQAGRLHCRDFRRPPHSDTARAARNSIDIEDTPSPLKLPVPPARDAPVCLVRQGAAQRNNCIEHDRMKNSNTTHIKKKHATDRKDVEAELRISSSSVKCSKRSDPEITTTLLRSSIHGADLGLAMWPYRADTSLRSKPQELQRGCVDVAAEAAVAAGQRRLALAGIGDQYGTKVRTWVRDKTTLSNFILAKLNLSSAAEASGVTSAESVSSAVCIVGASGLLAGIAPPDASESGVKVSTYLIGSPKASAAIV
ncbi:hypothetical protein OPT61_g3780 [Boeremia exigua]|uniref:Uncharacterized protein n=1 Tax=Boeremia exigua TaxID=749465 RepID=A0ACC2IGQ2_9PLEO|nr:hypothetical protein OPT61_g3780 [Boeremia exigua]